MSAVRKRIAIASITAVAAAGSGFAYAAGQGSSGARPVHVKQLRHAGLPLKGLSADFEAVAKYLGLTTVQLRRELAEGKSLADVAKAQNKDLAGLKKLIVERFEQHVDEIVEMSLPKLGGGPRLHGFKGGPPLPRGPRHFGFGLPGLRAHVAVVAEYLGLSRRELREQLADGKSLADVAKAEGKSVAGLKKVIVDELRKRFGDDAAKRFEPHVDDMLELPMPRFKHP